MVKKTGGITRAVISAILVLCLLTGCSGGLSSSVQDMLQAPTLNDQQNAILDTMYGQYGREIKLHYPKSGTYRTPVILFDIDGDGAKEAIVLYANKDEVNINIAILNYLADTDIWQVVMNQSSDVSTQVDFVDFSHITNRAYYNILVGWSVLGEESNVLSVYRYDGESYDHLWTHPYSWMPLFEDFDSDIFSELVIVTPATDTAGVKLSLYKGDSSGSIEIYREIELPTTIAKLYQVTSGPSEDGKRYIYVDGLTKNNAMVTNVVACDNTGMQLVGEDNLSEAISILSSRRQVDVLCENPLGEDDYIRVPIVMTKNTDSDGYYTGWNLVRDGRLEEDFQSYTLLVYSIRLIVPPQWGVVQFQYYSDGDVLHCVDSEGKVIYYIRRVSHDNVGEFLDVEGYAEIGRSGSYVYMCKLGDSQLVSDRDKWSDSSIKPYFSFTD